jgi:DNA-binding SARP family transcriptional activator
MDARPAARLSLVGTWSAEIAGRLVDPPPAARQVVALIAVRGPLSRSDAARLLHPGCDPRVAAARLRDLLSRSRRWPGLGGLVVVTPHLALADGVRVDLRRLDGMIAGLARGRVAALEALQEFPVDPELLPGWHQEWAAEARESLSRRLSRALCRFCAHRLQAGDVDSVLLAAEQAGRLDPMDEVAARWQIRAYLHGGDRALALRRFTDLHDLLAAELGVAPEPATRELLRGLPTSA